LLQLNPGAAQLNRQGFPAAAQYLQAMLQDFAGARQKYVEMYQSTAAIQSRWPFRELFRLFRQRFVESDALAPLEKPLSNTENRLQPQFVVLVFFWDW
jgi:hypothetical protein